MKIELTSGNKSVLVNKIYQVLQFGPTGSLKLDNEIFDNNLLEVAFNANNGAPSKIVFRAESKGEAESGAANSVADSYLKLRQDQSNDQIGANESLLKQANAQLAFEKSQSEFALAKVQSSTAIATTNAQTQQTLLSATLQMERDRQRLEAVRTGAAT